MRASFTRYGLGFARVLGVRLHPASIPAVVLALGLTTWACTRAGIFGTLEDPSLPDKITLSGTVCTDNPLEQRFPVKVIFMMDVSANAVAAAFPELGQLKTAALSDVVNLYGGAAEISFSMAMYDGETASVTMDEYTRDLQLLANAATRIGNPVNRPTSTQRRYDLALERAENLITGDLLTSDRGTRAKTRYVIVLYAEGPHTAGTRPDPDGGNPVPLTSTFCCNALCLPDQGGEGPINTCAAESECDLGCHYEREVRRIKDYVLDNGGADFVVHTAHYLPRRVMDPPDLSCGAGIGGEDQCAAEELLARMAAAGGGRYLQYRTTNEISFRSLEYSAANNVFVMKNLVAVNLSARPRPEGLLPDSDADGLDDAEEAVLGTNPLVADSDGDGIGDLLENLLSNLDLQQGRVDTPLACTNLILNKDTDGDGLKDCEEVLLGTDMTLFDTDADGFPDRMELFYGTNYLANDVGEDIDLDGARNGQELKQHTDPRSNDAKLRGEMSYLYSVVPQPIGKLLDVQQPRRISGVSTRQVSAATYPGAGVLRFNRGPQTLQWHDYGDPNFGPEVNVSERGRFTIHSAASNQNGERERSIEVEVIPQLLPPQDRLETMQVRETERQCIDWRIRNITLVHTSPRNIREEFQGNVSGNTGREGLNRIQLYFGEVPQNNPLSPGLFRVAEVEMIFIPPDTKSPDVAERNVVDPDFVLVGETQVTP